jgi:hypothetical protein
MGPAETFLRPYGAMPRAHLLNPTSGAVGYGLPPLRGYEATDRKVSGG